MWSCLSNEVSAEVDEGNNDNSICACVHPRAAARGTYTYDVYSGREGGTQKKQTQLGSLHVSIRVSARLTEHCSFLAFLSLRVLIHNPASTTPPLAQYWAPVRYLMLTAQNA